MSGELREILPQDMQVELISQYSRTKSPGARIQPRWVDQRDEARLILTTNDGEESYLTWGGHDTTDLLLGEEEFLNYAVELSHYINTVFYRDDNPLRVVRLYFEYAPLHDHDQVRSITREIRPTMFERVMEGFAPDPVYFSRNV